MLKRMTTRLGSHFHKDELPSPMTPSVYSSSSSSILSSTFDRRGSLATNTTGRTSISEYSKYISGGNYVEQGTFDLTNMGAAILPAAPARPKGTYRLTDFIIQRTLGTGSFGRVHLVRSKHNLRFYAIKVLNKEKIVRMKQVEHTNNEARILDLVQCPFIINIWGTFQDTANLYMVMDFVPGGELFTLLRRSGRFPDPVAKFYAAEVVLALSYMHGQGIVYRDLKPENILLNHDGHIKIADFGFAKQCEITWTLCGTPDYLAPEIIGQQRYGQSVDWYALGVLIYEMLSGLPPYHTADGNPVVLYEKIARGPAFIQWPPVIDARARHLIEHLMETDPSRRYGNMMGGPDDIYQHPWFTEVDWLMLGRRSITAPYLPKITGDGDASAFDRYPEDPASQAYGQKTEDPFGRAFPHFEYTSPAFAA